jgi:hypothetical protein
MNSHVTCAGFVGFSGEGCGWQRKFHINTNQPRSRLVGESCSGRKPGKWGGTKVQVSRKEIGVMVTLLRKK